MRKIVRNISKRTYGLLYLRMFCTSNSASLPVLLELFDQLLAALNVCEVGNDAWNSKQPAKETEPIAIQF